MNHDCKYEERLSTLEIKLVETNSDVKHIKDRLDNGISSTITKIFDKVNDMCPKVKENSYWVDKFKQSIWWMSTIGIGGGIIGLFFFFIKRGMQ